ncbi:hypothetical protein C0989_008572 [Termitomyces sp. Mn162]|nr:hypothetical protein C0989_008572 [Termitomyces sp. Mn162]
MYTHANNSLIQPIGYVFDSAEAILPYLEEPKTGPSSLFCQEVAKHLGCYVAGGYPERLSEEERRAESQAGTATEDSRYVLTGGTEILLTNNDASSGIVSLASAFAHRKVHTPVGANSAILYGPSGEWVGGYRKTNLFETDKTWAKAGTGFVSFSLTLPHVTSTESENAPAPNSLEMSIAICMDLNPAPSHEQTPSVEWSYELADYCVRNKSRLLVLLDAWLDSDSDDGEDEEDAGDGASDSANNNNHNNNHSYREKDGEVEGIVDAEADEPNWHTLRYWAARLQPLWGRDWRRPGSNETLLSDESGGNYDKAEGEEEALEEAIDNQEEDRPPHETIVVVCNRTGTENGV